MQPRQPRRWHCVWSNDVLFGNSIDASSAKRLTAGDLARLQSPSLDIACASVEIGRNAFLGLAARICGGTKLGDGSIADTLSKVTADTTRRPNTYVHPSGVQMTYQNRLEGIETNVSAVKMVSSLKSLVHVVIFRWPLLIACFMAVGRALQLLVNALPSESLALHVALSVAGGIILLTLMLVFLKAAVEQIVYRTKSAWLVELIALPFASFTSFGLIFIDSSFLLPVALRCFGSSLYSACNTHLHDFVLRSKDAFQYRFKGSAHVQAPCSFIGHATRPGGPTSASVKESGMWSFIDLQETKLGHGTVILPGCVVLGGLATEPDTVMHISGTNINNAKIHSRAERELAVIPV